MFTGIGFRRQEVTVFLEMLSFVNKFSLAVFIKVLNTFVTE